MLLGTVPFKRFESRCLHATSERAVHGPANSQEAQRREGRDAGGNGARQLIQHQVPARDVGARSARTANSQAGQRREGPDAGGNVCAVAISDVRLVFALVRVRWRGFDLVCSWRAR